MSEDKMQIPEESVLDSVKRGKRFLQNISPEVAFNRDGDMDLICILGNAENTIEALQKDKAELLEEFMQLAVNAKEILNVNVSVAYLHQVASHAENLIAKFTPPKEGDTE